MGALSRLGSTYTFRRFAPGRYVNGEWVNGVEVIPQDDQGNEVAFSMVASIQRLTAQEMLALPEGERSSERITIYTETKLEKGDEATKTKGDIVLYNGREYEVRKVENWMETPQPHYTAVAVLLENTNGG